MHAYVCMGVLCVCVSVCGERETEMVEVYREHAHVILHDVLGLSF